jgi:hypothetical protein
MVNRYTCTNYILHTRKVSGHNRTFRQGSARAAREGSHLSKVHLGFISDVNMHSDVMFGLISQENFQIVWGSLLKPWLDWPGFLASEIPSWKPGPWQANGMAWLGGNSARCVYPRPRHIWQTGRCSCTAVSSTAVTAYGTVRLPALCRARLTNH